MKSHSTRPILIAALTVAALAAAMAQQQTPPAQQLPPVIPGAAPPAAQAPAVQTPPAQLPPGVIPGVAAAPAAPVPAAQTPPAQQPPPVIPGAAPPAAQAPAVQAPPATTPATAPAQQAFNFEIPNGSLTDFIEIVAKRLGISYVLDPAVGAKGSVSLFTYGENRPTDLMTLLETILRVNGATIVKVGEIYRIVPINKISSLPLDPMVNIDQKTLPEDERMMLNLIFLKYSTAKEIETLITPFLGEGASHSTYEAANLLILQDNARNMKRTLKLIEMFDSESFAGQRVKLFGIENSRPSDLVKELDTVFKAYAFSDKNSPVKFIPVDRINTVIAVAPNPGIFPQVQEWINKLDIAVKIQAGEVSTYVYRLKYSRAATTALAITALYTGNVSALMGLAAMSQGNGLNGGGMGGGGGYGGMGGGYGGGGYGGGGYGGGGYGVGGGYGGGGYGGGGYGMGNYGMGGGGYGGGGYGGGYGQGGGGMIPPIATTPTGGAGPVPLTGPNSDLTGMALGAAGMVAGGPNGPHVPHIVPNPFDNTLLVQGTPQEWQQINNLLRQIDVPPRQVLIEMKIYELDLTGAFSAGITAYMEQQGTNASGLTRALSIATGSTGLGLSVGTLVGNTREILGVLQLQETHGNARIISAPSIIATDSIPATMNVGEDVPVLTSQAVVPGAQAGGNSLFANTVGSESTGVTMNILARVSPAGVVTMVIDQDVSSPEQNSASGIDSPSFQQRQFQTQLTVQDGDTVAIGGAIQQTKTTTVSGIPILDKIPLIGPILFGSKSTSLARTEVIVFITPKVLYDTNQLLDATEELKDSLTQLKKTIDKQ
jgi:general secretion pathway protein D